MPPYDELIWIVKEDRFSDPRIARFLAAIEEATLVLLNDPKAPGPISSRPIPRLDDRLNRQAGSTRCRAFRPRREPWIRRVTVVSPSS